ncbi:MAG: co-chaperone GroES, partial [Euryarchaeota archaeon]|nr:co-chaperone GroES [Euryarchaeota archaeon]
MGVKTAVKLEPLGDRVVVRPSSKEEVTRGGIVIPDTAKEKPQEGEVLAVGPGRMTEDGKRIAMDVKVGDIVIYAKYGGTEIKENDEEL